MIIRYLQGNWKRLLQLSLTITALIALLSYTFVHTASLLARYIHPPFVGYIAAFGIETAIVVLSQRIGDLRKSRQSPALFYGVLTAVLVVSAVANVSEGFEVKTGTPLNVVNVATFDVVQGVIALSATLLIPLIVFSLSEIIGTDVGQLQQTMTKMTRQTPKMSDLSDLGNKKKRQIVDNRRDRVKSLLSEDVPIGDIAQSLEVSTRTIQRDIEAINANGVTK